MINMPLEGDPHDPGPPTGSSTIVHSGVATTLQQQISNNSPSDASNNNNYSEISHSTYQSPDVDVEQTDNTRREKTIRIKITMNKYLRSDPGPYSVFIESTNEQITKIHPMKIGKLIYKDLPRYKNSVKNVSIVSRKKVKVDLNSYDAANNLISEKLFTERNLVAYIPVFFTRKSGIIRHIPTDTTIEEIKEDIESPVAVTDVVRFTRKGDRDTPIGTVKLTFLSQVIPPYVRLHGMRVKVEPFVSATIQCRKCLSYHHKREYCRRSPRCAFCMLEHESESCKYTGDPQCIFCIDPEEIHCATDHQRCPEFKKQKMIKEKMTLHNLSYREAQEEIDKETYAKVLGLDVCSDIDNFPFLPGIPDSRDQKRKKSGSDSENESQTNQPTRGIETRIIHVPKRQRSYNTHVAPQYPSLPKAVHLEGNSLHENPRYKKNLSQGSSNEYMKTNRLAEDIFSIMSQVKRYPDLGKEEIIKIISNNILKYSSLSLYT